MIATENSYKNLMKDKELVIKFDSVPMDTMPLTIYERLGSYQNCYYKVRELNITSIEPRPQQQEIIERIQEHHRKYQHTVAYLHGPPGSGKSLVGVLLANDYSGSYCNTLKPWQPGDNFADLYSEAEPSEDKPLIVVFDEFDAALMKIHEGIAPHKHLPTQVSDKNGWNQLLDSIQRGMYPHTILLLTSNRRPEFIDELDTSYIRKGRVDIIAELNTQP
jgi:SpoVK/Ycf46/Vps4 family AAA+-type ATPase